ncbi:MAG: HAMP domain-containing protein [Spirochaetes bacterium]|nr:HAMP domain-containing protein [Spirochaetota bacterium]
MTTDNGSESTQRDSQTGIVYRIIETIPGLKGLAAKGGILLKWTVLISLITVVIVALLSVIFTLMASSALKGSARQLCQTIAGNISSAESIITAERSTFRRSVILQDIVSGLSKSKIDGFEYAAVYDISGNLVEREKAYAAHTVATKRARPIPRDLYGEIRGVRDFQEERIVCQKDSESIPCYRYRMPFKFFNVPVGVIEVVFTEESILGPVNRMRLYIIILGVLILCGGVAISVFVARGMVKPINLLSSGMHRVRDGDLGVELSINRHDELGELGGEFNNLINHLREKLQMQKFVSESTISMIREHSKSGDIGLGGKRQNFAFLFSDIRGFTAMSEKLEPENVVSILNEYLDLQAQIIKKNKGDIDKFVGDEVMAVFSGPGKADHAFASAIEIIDSIKKLNDKRMKENKITVEVGIGIHSGDVVHGRMGSRDRMDNTSIGDAVNLSARLCSQADAGTIIVSKNVLSTATKGKFVGKKLEPVRVKGKAKPIDIYQITGMKK